MRRRASKRQNPQQTTEGRPLPAGRTIARMPLDQLWDDQGEIPGTCLSRLDREEIETLLENGKVQFVEANIAHPLKWIPVNESQKYWQRVRGNVSDTSRFYLDEWPGGFAFAASEWRGRSGERIVLLEMHH